ncbi:sodium/potassium/calcium exchanger 4-like [Schistocerca americana]|uniref:sodium/potassium/calcium exchanger 4-like n=1 Tax=Schistocerca americana TaxID=7009 RepID=UPI001F4F4DA7|nr:sodium/potassium/calcium exchanger 4-like [Schistocerca americana]
MLEQNSLLELMLQTTYRTDAVYGNESCIHSSITDFPATNLTREQLLSGFIVLYFLGAAYGFLLAALVCEIYFLPCVDVICEVLNLTPDVAGATFMAFATSAPELAMTAIGVFITESDIGLGAVVGSSVFNILGIAAFTGLAARETITLDKWPLTRDTTIYAVALFSLVASIWDDKITWIESAIMVLLIVTYILIMVYNKKLKYFFENTCRPRRCQKHVFSMETTDVGQGIYRPYFLKMVSLTPRNSKQPRVSVIERQMSDITDDGLKNLNEETQSLRHPPAGAKWYGKLYWLLCWPALLLLKVTIPDCSKPKLRKLFPLTFFMCIVWIGLNAYFVSWMITVIGDTFHIRDSVMGLTFLAAGACFPEVVTTVIMVRKGEGSMGISNSLGANTLGVLMCLGLPWLLKSASSSGVSVHIVSNGMRFTLLAMLVLTIVYRWGMVTAFRHRANRLFGLTCLFLYLAYLAVSVAMELNAFGYINGPVCEWI